ncbi:MAG: hypothetical protein IPP63_01135 [Chloracidobacterium sp.]|nr:hypothetical protein [Chloracidobacterium sp.]
MNRSFSIVSCALIALMLVSFVSAQSSPSMDELFKQIATLSNTKKPEDMEKAFQLSKDFLKRFGNEKDNRIAKVKTFYVSIATPLFMRRSTVKSILRHLLSEKRYLLSNPTMLTC